MPSLPGLLLLFKEQNYLSVGLVSITKSGMFTKYSNGVLPGKFFRTFVKKELNSSPIFVSSNKSTILTVIF